MLQGYLTLTSAAGVTDYRVKEVVHAQQVVLSVSLTALTLIADVRITIGPAITGLR